MPEQQTPYTLYFGLGSNLGDRLDNLRQAIATLAPVIAVEKISPIYETAPQYVTEQPNFYNAVCRGSTSLSPVDTLQILKNVERQMGRSAGPRFGPRVIDLDILFYDNVVLETPDLVVPHPHLHERTFVLVPLVDIAPEFIHPKLGVTVTDLLQRLGNYVGQIQKTDVQL